MYFCPLKKHKGSVLFLIHKKSRCSSVVEYILGKDGVMSSTLINGSFFLSIKDLSIKILFTIIYRKKWQKKNLNVLNPT